MVISFRAISQPPQSGLEALLRVVGVLVLGVLTCDLYTPHGYIETHFNNHFKYEEQLYKRVHEKIENNKVDDEVRAYLGRGQNKFSGLVPACKKSEK
jgi:hypothetical protein